MTMMMMMMMKSSVVNPDAPCGVDPSGFCRSVLVKSCQASSESRLNGISLLTFFFLSNPAPTRLLRRCPFPSERQARLEAVREVFLAAYSSTVGLKSSAPSPSGAISGLLEQFARGVGLRGTNAIV